jgi:2-methylfumaryl-CoA hydratase
MHTPKTNPGNYFEDFSIGQRLIHATPRTVTSGDTALYTALFGPRFPAQSSAEFARKLGFSEAPVDDLLAFHTVFGKTVPDISLNAVANLGYAECRFLKPVYPGDTLSSVSEVIGLKQNSNGKTGIVYVRSTGSNQSGEAVLSYVRWVMVRKRDEASPAPEAFVPDLADVVAPGDLVAPDADFGSYDFVLAGAPHTWGDYEVGEKIDHVDGMTIEEAEHMMATRSFQNTAKVHFNQYTEGSGRFGRRLIYGGHVISLARALSFNGLGNAAFIAAINAGAHVAPCFAGNTIHAWSEVVDKAELAGRADCGVLRIRTIATKDQPCAEFPLKTDDGKNHEAVILNLDYWVVMPR